MYQIEIKKKIVVLLCQQAFTGFIAFQILMTVPGGPARGVAIAQTLWLITSVYVSQGSMARTVKVR